MSETTKAFLDRMERALADLAPRLAGDDPGAVTLRAEHAVATDRLKAARRAAAGVSEDELRAVRLAVERMLQHAGKRAA